MKIGTAGVYVVQAVIDSVLGLTLLVFGLLVGPEHDWTPVSLAMAPATLAAAILSGWIGHISVQRKPVATLRVALAILQLVTASLPWMLGGVGVGCLFGCISTGPIAWWYVADPLFAVIFGSGVLITGAGVGLLVEDSAAASIP